MLHIPSIGNLPINQGIPGYNYFPRCSCGWEGRDPEPITHALDSKKAAVRRAIAHARHANAEG